MATNLKIALAQLNPLVGDVIGNVDKLISVRSNLDDSIDSENKDLDYNLSDLSTIIDQNVKNINHRIVYKLSVYIPDIIAFSDEEYDLMISNGSFRERSELEAYIEENRKRYVGEGKETYGLKHENIAILANYKVNSISLTAQRVHAIVKKVSSQILFNKKKCKER